MLLRETTIAARSKCLLTMCKRRSVRGKRGLCDSDYQGFAKLVRDGVTTWRQLEEQGLVLQTRTTLKQLIGAQSLKVN
jgi:hypothetical protein